MKSGLLIGLAALSITVAYAAKDPILMTINGKGVKLSEFEYLYHKNNQQQLQKETLDQYVNRFVTYKLKVADAEANKIDTLKSFSHEFEGYKNDIVKKFLEDTTVYDAVMKENYKRFGVDSRAKIFTGDASAIIPVLTGKYDLIFLDGPKGHYYEYLPYLKDALNVGGVLFADDVAFHGYIKGDAPRKHSTIKRSIENYLSAVTRDKDFLTRVYDTEDGFCVSEKLDGSNRGNT